MGQTNPTCNICGSPTRAVFPAIYGNQPMVAGVPINIDHQPWIRQCDTCGFRFTDQPADYDAILRCYEQADTDVWLEDPHNDVRRGFAERVSLIEQHAKTKRVLDIGCYTGAFLNRFDQAWDRFGIELSEKAAEIATDRGIEILGDAFHSTDFGDRKFGVICFLNVIEHITDPKDFMKQVAERLEPGGLVFVETGDIDTWFSRILGRYWSYYYLPEHVAFFRLRTLKRLVTDAGLEVVAERTGFHHKRPFGLKPWIIHLLRIAKASTQSWTRHITRWFGMEWRKDQPPFWLVHSDHMYVLARKPDIAE